MKKRSKVRFLAKLFIPLVLISLIGIGTVHASTKYSNWGYNISPTYAGLSWQKKDNTSSKKMTINWTDAEARNFRLRFRVLNENYSQIDSCTVNYLGSISHNIPTVNGREYLLQGKRENIVDPTVYCKGNWRIN